MLTRLHLHESLLLLILHGLKSTGLLSNLMRRPLIWLIYRMYRLLLRKLLILLGKLMVLLRILRLLIELRARKLRLLLLRLRWLLLILRVIISYGSLPGIALNKLSVKINKTIGKLPVLRGLLNAFFSVDYSHLKTHFVADRSNRVWMLKSADYAFGINRLDSQQQLNAAVD